MQHICHRSFFISPLSHTGGKALAIQKNYYLYREEVKPPAGAANYIGNISGMPQKDFARHCRTIGAEYCYTV